MSIVKIDAKYLDALSKIELDFKQESLQIDTSPLSETDNLLKVSRKYKQLKALVVTLANKGYYLTLFSKGISTFSKYQNAEQFLPFLTKKNYNYKVLDNLIYDLKLPEMMLSESNLLVIFSSFQIYPYLDTSVDKRFFLKDFPSIQKYVPANTYVLRIADVGGVAGNFYLNTNFDSNIEVNVSKLIDHVRKSINVLKRNIVLFGFSKGATASLYYGIKYNYKAVAIDPILSDEYHIKTYNDSHFTVGIFPESKQAKFKKLMSSYKTHKNLYIISSQSSQQFYYIQNFIWEYDLKKNINLVESNHPDIKEHPDVGPNTINLTIMLLNAIFYKVNKKASFTVPC
ncbi:MAG: XcbB/CpsF family capsular polysaccharide biosynthesis protein [Sulfurovum sp.]|nr:XcbB/CpsF family capsular polysaccharide biosynthesis protein [Sulfurovum sp.]